MTWKEMSRWVQEGREEKAPYGQRGYGRFENKKVDLTIRHGLVNKFNLMKLQC